MDAEAQTAAAVTMAEPGIGPEAARAAADEEGFAPDPAGDSSAVGHPPTGTGAAAQPVDGTTAEDARR